MKKKREPSRKTRQKNTTNYHSLEDRLLLAVTANLSNSQVAIGGDAFDNTVIVRQVGSELQVDVANQGTFSFNFNDVSTVRFIGNAGNDFFENQTDLTTIATGGNGNDTLISGNGNDRLFGNAGNDTLTSLGGDNLFNSSIGDDTITGGAGDDTILTADGDDTIHSGAGDDFIIAGNDNDVVYAGDGNDTVFASAGNDLVFGEAGDDSLFSQDGIDEVFGGTGNDLIRGGTGNDTLEGGDGDDRFYGEDGNDTIRGENGSDVVFGGDQSDWLFGDGDNDFLFGGLGNDEIHGGNGSDRIRGNEGSDDLYGDAGNDRVAGDDGNDFLDGGNGADTVLGDAGVDEIVGTSTDFVRGGSGNDFITLSGSAGDTAAFLGNYADFLVTESGPILYVNDTTGAEGLDAITGADSISFANLTRTATADVSQRVFIQPIVASNTNGSNSAEFFGTPEQEATIKRLIDEIYLQANVDIEWLSATQYNNTFANVGTTSPRPLSDLNTIVTNGDAAGVGNSDPLIIDAYFVEIAPGFENLSENFANGLAFLDANGTAIHIGDVLPTFAGGQDTISRVVAHEISHNLGLDHVHDDTNLANEGSPGDQLNASQIAMILNSQFTQII